MGLDLTSCERTLHFSRIQIRKGEETEQLVRIVAISNLFFSVLYLPIGPEVLRLEPFSRCDWRPVGRGKVLKRAEGHRDGIEASQCSKKLTMRRGGVERNRSN